MTLMSRRFSDSRVQYAMMFDDIVRELTKPSKPEGRLDLREWALNGLYRFLYLVRSDSEWFAYPHPDPDVIEHEAILPVFLSSIPDGFTADEFISKVRADCRILAVPSPFTVEQEDIDRIITFCETMSEKLKKLYKQ